MDKVGVVKETRNIVSEYLLMHGIMHSGHLVLTRYWL